MNTAAEKKRNIYKLTSKWQSKTKTNPKKSSMQHSLNKNITQAL